MWSISAVNGVTMESLAAYNGLSVSSLLLPGQVSQVPAPRAVSATPASAPGWAMCPALR